MEGERKAVSAGGEPRKLQEAVRKARLVEAERSDVIVDLKAAEMTRLEALRDALADVFAEIPADMPQFDLALQRASEPRLWVDMVAFVVMGRDRETYRFVQDGQNGRRVLLEGKDVEAMAGRVTDYVAFRMVEREKALAAVEAESQPFPGAKRARGAGAGGKGAAETGPAGGRRESARASGLAARAALGWFVFGLGLGIVGLLVIGWLLTMPG